MMSNFLFTLIVILSIKSISSYIITNHKIVNNNKQTSYSFINQRISYFNQKITCKLSSNNNNIKTNEKVVSKVIKLNDKTKQITINEINKSNDIQLDKQAYIILFLLFLVTLLGALDRVAISVAIIPMSTELHLDDTTKGIISGMFSIGYMFGLIPAGLIGSFSSPKVLLLFGVFIWSLAQIISPYFATIAIPLLYACRFLMGFAEACIVPSVQTFVARWVPEDSRSKVLGVILSGFQLGTVGAYLISPEIMSLVSWPGLFIVFGAIGFLWMALWLPLAKDNPVNYNEISKPINNPIISKSNNIPFLTAFQSKPATIAVVKEEEKTESFFDQLKSVPWEKIRNTKELYAIAIAHAVQNFGLYINLSWLPTFFNQRYDLSVADSSFSSVGPWIGGAVLGSLAGFTSDKLVELGYDKTLIRKFAQSIALITPAVILTLLSLSNDISPQTVEIYFTAAIASAAVCVAGFGSSVQDICKSPKLTPILYGITSVPAVLMGSVGVYGTGIVLDQSHDWNVVFQGVAIIYCIGAIVYASLYEAKKIFD